MGKSFIFNRLRGLKKKGREVRALDQFIVVLAIGTASAAMAATDPSRYEIQGVKLGQTKAQVVETLKASGYKQSNVEGRNCKDTYESFIARKIASKATTVSGPEFLCDMYFSKGDSKAEAKFYLGQRGHVLSSLRYEFRTTEPGDVIYRRLVAQLGPSDRPFSNGTRTTWSSTPGSVSAPSFRFEGSGPNRALAMTGGQVMADTFRDEIGKELVRRAGSSRTPL